jgi:hypothetical protein
MKLIKTVKNLLEETEKLYEESVQKSLSKKELEKLEKDYDETIQLVSRFKKLSGK